MHVDEPNWEALARFFAGESGEEERARILSWAGTDARHRAVLETARQTWHASGHAARQWDARAAWSRVQPRLQGGTAEAPTGARAPRRFAAAVARRPIAALLASALAGGALVGAALWTWARRAGPAGGPQELATARGARATLRLADGSRIVLAPDSRLAVSRHFGGARREVELTGEAFFDVVPDAHRPFVVRSGSTVTEVLGTEFGVRAYADEPSVQVVVEEGRVSFRARSGPARDAALLLPGELGEVAVGGARVTRRRVDPDAYLSWRQGVLRFEDAPLTQVVAQLAHWYGVEVRIGDPALGTRRLTASFHDQSLDEVTAVIAASLGLDCARVGDVRTFFPKGQARAYARGRDLARARPPYPIS